MVNSQDGYSSRLGHKIDISKIDVLDTEIWVTSQILIGKLLQEGNYNKYMQADSESTSVIVKRFNGCSTLIF